MFLSLLASLAIAQFEPTFTPKTDLSHYELAGSVRQVTEWIQGAQWQQTSQGGEFLPADQGSRNLASVTTFSEAGLAQEKHYFSSGEIHRSEVWKYDTYGNLTQWDSYMGDSEELINRRILIFDHLEEIEERKAIGKRIEDADGEILGLFHFEFDEQGRLSSVHAIDSAETIQSIRRYEYSENGRAITVYPFDQDLAFLGDNLRYGRVSQLMYVYHLDEDGALIHQEQHILGVAGQSKTALHYNPQGRMIQMDVHSHDGRVERMDLEYTFDEKGNWLEMKRYRVSHGSDPFLFSISIREIEYYSE